MFPRPASLIACLALLPALLACSGAEPPPPPLSEEALAAVSDDPGAPAQQLARQVDDLFAGDAAGETRALIVMHGGEIAAERYAPGYGRETRFASWSMAKTVTAVMIGMLVADGRLALDESPPVPRWQRPGDPRGEITLRQLLQMRSGLRHTEAGDPPYESSEVRMLFLDGRDDMADWAESQPLEAEPGSTFEYSSATSVILADIAARVLSRRDEPEARREAVAGYLHTRLFGPLAMESMVPEFDASGTLIGGSLIHGTARDWARFGDFLRHKGSYRGSQLVPRKWVEAMTRPSPRRENYGFQTWLNRPVPGESDNPLFPGRAPRSMFAAIGHMGQYILVSPEQKLTVVRLGHSDAEERAVLLQELADIVELYPAT
ncbi:serine hydrolase domain-containing protein [Pelagerythrobacter marinus]|jgi:CubicO group peptidase (beta-lactamase class C family)|uniref:Serine hydrolase n=1 Tax=Pelagerythrobacter marinus TaxID=538382 RepID=A0ABW9UY59_9SPHN|nr:serine hydrolase [Pelagerythrobacter marinus]MXO68817.1 serine hydrolase [Pelagerythrobacter marinus]USA39125.1 beta-lactamase family protein [Pelagerythrobacter marinus]WPZ06788.1 serine hydrolase [Pelagerythrobacter marinus]